MTKGLKRRQLRFYKRLNAKCRHNGEHILIKSEYINSKTPIIFQCLDCGKVFKAKPQSLVKSDPSKVRKYICPTKVHNYKVHTLKVRQKIFYERLNKKCQKTGEHILIESPYINDKQPIKFRCLDCNRDFTAKPQSIIRATPNKRTRHFICPFKTCHSRKKLNTKVYKIATKHFIKKLKNKEKHTGEHIKFIGKYKNGKTPVRLKCLDCGLKFSVKPDNILSGRSRKYICPNRMPKQYKHQPKHRHHWNTTKVADYIKGETGGEYILKSKFHSFESKISIQHKSKHCPYYIKHNQYYTFQMRFDNFIHGARCPIDAWRITAKKERKTTSQFQHEVSKINKTFIVKSEYRGKNKHIILEHHSKNCIEYKIFHRYSRWITTPDSFFRYKSPLCPAENIYYKSYGSAIGFCNDKEKYWLARVLIYKYLKNEYKLCGDYKGVENESLFMHVNKKCAYYQKHHKFGKFYSSLDNLVKNGCPFDHSTSHGEDVLNKYFHNKLHLKKSCSRHFLTAGADYIYGYIMPKNDSSYTPKRQHFDFYFPNLKYDNYYTNGIEIEFNGEQHFSPTPYFNSSDNKRSIIMSFGSEISKDFLRMYYCCTHHIKQINIDNPNSLEGNSLHKLIIKSLNKKILPVLHRNSDIIFREENE